MPIVCLCAIFRNESRNVVRCLDALRPLIDCASVCDTGSTDDTPALLKAWGRDNGVPMRIHHTPFRDFGTTRSLSFELARRAFPGADYLLLLDADMVLHIEPSFDKTALDADHYLLRQRNGVLDYWNTRLVRAALPWRCVGVTHEYWECEAPVRRASLETLWIDDRGDGGFKQDKLERDVRLLSGAIDRPDTPQTLRIRYLFYLAQTLRDQGDHEAAFEWYGRRVDAGGWAEETYLAQCERAQLSATLGHPHERVVAEHVKAWVLRPTRAEALWQLARLCRERGRYAEGYLYAKTGQDIEYPRGDILFIRRDVYEWRMLDEFAICAYWIGRYRESFEAGERLLREERFPEIERERLVRNLAFARERMESL